MSIRVDFCGETSVVEDDQEFVLGREGDLVIDDNPYLHRHFLKIDRVEGLWRLSNLGSQLSATVSDRAGLLQSWLAPGAQLPLVLPHLVVLFTAGPTTYELEITVDDAPFAAIVAARDGDGQTTIGYESLTPDQRLLIVALAETALRELGHAGARLPSTADAAQRLGWTVTKFNRKLDNVCHKLSEVGVRGLHGDVDRLASSRRARLVEFAVASGLVTSGDLTILPPRKSD